MLSKTDIKTLTSLLATKSDVIDLKDDFVRLKKNLNRLVVLVKKSDLSLEI